MGPSTRLERSNHDCASTLSAKFLDGFLQIQKIRLASCKQDFKNGTFVPLKWKYFSKPLYMLYNQTPTNQIVCFDPSLNILGDTSLITIQAVSLCLALVTLVRQKIVFCFSWITHAWKTYKKGHISCESIRLFFDFEWWISINFMN